MTSMRNVREHRRSLLRNFDDDNDARRTENIRAYEGMQRGPLSHNHLYTPVSRMRFPEEQVIDNLKRMEEAKRINDKTTSEGGRKKSQLLSEIKYLREKIGAQNAMIDQLNKMKYDEKAAMNTLSHHHEYDKKEHLLSRQLTTDQRRSQMPRSSASSSAPTALHLVSQNNAAIESLTSWAQAILFVVVSGFLVAVSHKLRARRRLSRRMNGPSESSAIDMSLSDEAREIERENESPRKRSSLFSQILTFLAFQLSLLTMAFKMKLFRRILPDVFVRFFPSDHAREYDSTGNISSREGFLNHLKVVFGFVLGIYTAYIAAQTLKLSWRCAWSRNNGSRQLLRCSLQIFLVMCLVVLQYNTNEFQSPNYENKEIKQAQIRVSSSLSPLTLDEYWIYAIIGTLVAAISALETH